MCVRTLIKPNHIVTVHSKFSMLTDYLLGQANTTLDFKCIRQVSNSLPVTMLDFDGNTVIPPYNMRTGTDQKIIEHTV